jgi:hypothetical protein
VRARARATKRPTATSAKPKRAARSPVASTLPTSPEEIPDAASLPELLGLLERCKKALALAENDQNLPLIGQMIRVAAQLSETIRKATPPEPADPNDAPDMIALRVEAARKWHEMIDLVAGDAERETGAPVRQPDPPPAPELAAPPPAAPSPRRDPDPIIPRTAPAAFSAGAFKRSW